MTYPSLITAAYVLSISNRCEPFPFFAAEQPRGLNTPTGVALPSAPKMFLHVIFESTYQLENLQKTDSYS